MVAALLAVVAVGLVELPTGAAERLAVIAHRGDRGVAPENTGSAFRSAVATGATGIEMDVRFSRTAHPVVMHDATLDRTTDCSGPVSSFSRLELRRCDAGSWFGAGFRGERVPSLNMALRAVAARSDSVKVVLHVKVLPDATRARRVMEAVKRYGMGRRTIIIADADSILARMRAAGFKRLGLVFSTSSGWRKAYDYMIPYDVPLDARGIAAAHRRGGKVWAVEGHPAGLAALLALTTVDGILVDRPGPSLRLPSLPSDPLELPALPEGPAR